MAKKADRYFALDPWHVRETGFDEAHARVAESVFVLSNEHMGVRGYFEEDTASDSLLGSYFNGIYESDDSAPKSYKGIATDTHFMVNAVNWLFTRIEADGERLIMGKSEISEFSRTLSLREGTLARGMVWTLRSGKKLKLNFLRFVSMCESAQGYQRIELTPLNFSGDVTVECGADFNAVHETMGKCFWRETRKGFASDDAVGIVGQTLASRQSVFAGFTLHCMDAKQKEKAERNRYIGLKLTLSLREGKRTRVDKLVTCLSNPEEVDAAAFYASGMHAVEAQAKTSLEAAKDAQATYWEKHWEDADIVIEGENQAANQQGIRFAIFQLTQTYHGASEKHNVGAKGLTGEFYNGHAFWDTESFCLPYYLFTDPKAARSLLEYRYHTLGAAKRRAAMLDCNGACYPVATINGDEACTLWQHASLQFQTDTAIAYAIRHYALVTGDKAFLYEKGIRMLVEICRFLATRGGYSAKTGEFGYFGVMGPDEFHMMVNNDCYTNYMSKATFLYALEALDAMKKDAPESYSFILKDMGIEGGELAQWKCYANSMRIPQDKEKGVFEQHDGYFLLPHIDVNAIPREEFPLYHHWSYDRIYRTDMIKQPSVLMMLFLYASRFDIDTKRVNYEFYEPRTIHESSLSPSVHSVLACELGKSGEAMNFFEFATRLDLDDYNRNTREGLHTTSLAAAWLNIVYGFGGMRSDDTRISLNPVLPEGWTGYSFVLNINGSRLSVRVGENGVELSVTRGVPLSLNVYGKSVTVGAEVLRYERE